jgi:hypothetical protein
MHRLIPWTLGLVALAGCSGGSSGPIYTEGPGGGGVGPSPVIPEGGSPLANGTCSFTLDAKVYTLPGYAMMNGGGNLRIECGLSDMSLELGAGNATFDGPGEYPFLPSNSMAASSS